VIVAGGPGAPALLKKGAQEWSLGKLFSKFILF